MNPVYFRNQPVGCTATIIYQMYKERGIEIPDQIAGLLVSAILSDTLIFRSPTCTQADRDVAQTLAKQAGIDPVEYATAMFEAGSDLRSKTPEEIFYTDFKTFENEETTIGIGQITSMSTTELQEIAEVMKPFIKKAYKNHGLDMAFFMLTNIIEESTTMLCYGDKVNEIIESAFGVQVHDNQAVIEHVVSRKKQVVPSLMTAIAREQEDVL